MRRGLRTSSKVQWYIVAILLIIVLVVLFFENKINLSPKEDVNFKEDSSAEFDVGAVPVESLTPNSDSNVLTLQEVEGSQKKVSYVEGELIVKFNSKVVDSNDEVAFSVESLNELATKYEVNEVVELFPNIEDEDENLQNTYSIKFDSEKDSLDAVIDYSADENVEYAELNYLAKTNQVTQPVPPMPTTPLPPNDPLYSQQWALPNIDSLRAWASVRTPSSGPVFPIISVPVIAVIDTGVQWSHVDLANNIWINTREIPNNNLDDDTNGFIDDDKGWDFVETTSPCILGEDCTIEDNNPDDFHGHGTHVAGIAGAVTNNNLGVAGVCANFCKIMPVRAGFAVQGGGGALETDDIAQSLVYAADNGANIISMSFGGMDSILMQNAINYAYSQGAVLVAAAGNRNTGSTIESFPAAYPEVISVAATDSNDNRASFSNFGAWVDISAPGVLISSTVAPTSQMTGNPQYAFSCVTPNECYQLLSGTSMAAPVVAGVVGLALAKNPSLTQNQVLTLVHSAYDLLTGNEYIGTGRTNAFKAVQPTSVLITLLDPSLDSQFYGGQASINITGTSTGSSFQSYQVSFGSGVYPTSWTTIQSGTTQVNSNILGVWNTNLYNLAPGTFSLRISSTDTLQRFWEDKTVITIDPTLAPGWPKQISYKYGTSPALLDVDNDGDGEIFFQTKGLNSGSFYDSFHGIDHNGLPLPGWPIGLSTNIGAGFNFFSPSVANIDSDASLEIVNGNEGWGINQYSVHKTNGATQPGWPLTIGTGYVNNIGYIAAIADITGVSGKEIVVLTLSNNGNNLCDAQNKIYVYQQDGQIAPGWPIIVQCVPRGIAVGDIDNNGDQEIILTTLEPYTGGVPNAYVFNHDGTNFPGWPKASFSSWSAPVLADLDQNDGGRLEIVLAQGQLQVFNHDGTAVPGWPQPYDSTIYAPAIGDVDGNGDLEIVFTSFDIAGGHTLYVLNHDGTTVSGWPVHLNGYTASVGGGWDPPTSPVLVDIDGDGSMDILVVTSRLVENQGKLFGFTANGIPLPNFPKPLKSLASAPVAGKIDADNLLDVFLIDNTGLMYLWEFNGPATSSALQWPMFHHDPQRTGKY